MSEYTSYEIWNIVSYPIITILRPLVALPFFEAGILLKKIIKKKNVSILIAFVALIVWFAGNVFYHEQVDLSTLMIHNPVLYYLLGICGSYALSIFCEKIVLIASGPIHFVGRYSLLYMFCNTIPNITIIASWLHMDEVVPIEFISIVVTETVLVLLLIRFGSFIYKYDNMKKLFLGCRKNEI